ncbi:hypothetical protein C8F04DRAFT_457312 [Mycena alexandri]|uniref:Uncharacterized protein n=1 Tax=Mycena alexandri TaxID=1745969 RepID=A0AAD6T1W7_9AGAR|nr:hypothetical protein C8F04DRAFT_457312 [Mycena alexandri]
MATSQQQSVSPNSRRSFSKRISAVGAKISGALSNEGQGGERSTSGGRHDPETDSIASTLVEADRSVSRSRDSGYYSSGRGGAGNIHRIVNADRVSDVDVQEFPWPRGRERAPVSRGHVRSTGRGGSGNFRQSPSPRELSYSPRELEILRTHAETERNALKSSGRGGAGNIAIPNASGWDAGARSRSRSIDPVSSPTSLRPNLPPTPNRSVGVVQKRLSH